MNNSMSELGRTSHYLPSDYPSMLPPYDYMQLPPISLDRHQDENYNHRQMKQLVDEMRFKEKMQAINRKKGKYKRSTNNCHKKYIGIVKNLVCLKLTNEVKEEMLSRFFQYRNSRVYYFIILSYLKWYLTPADIRWVFEHFCHEVSNKIQRYQMEINITSNSNFIHFRRDEIVEMQFSIRSIYDFLTGSEQESMRLLYQKNKYIIIKKNQYLKTMQIIRHLKEELEHKFQQINIHKKEQELNLDQVYRVKEREMHVLNPIAMAQERQWTVRKLIEKQERRDIKLKQEKISERDQSEEPSNNLPENQRFTIYKNQVLVKQEEKGEESLKKYPLLCLENSYPIIDFMTWQSWLITKQKRLQFFIKSKEEMINKALKSGESPLFTKPQ